ncbi:MAG: NifU N-terminal domain-containing protein [Planctomycetota bacterium]
MAYTITRYEPTPNPNALKCWLEPPISAGPQSFLSSDMAADHVLAQKLFAAAPITTLFFNGDWMTVNKAPNASWTTVKKAVNTVLETATI